jgi:probable rRNA maturation factor
MNPAPAVYADAGPAVDVLIESSCWDQLPAAAAIVERAVAQAAGSPDIKLDGASELSILLCDDRAIAELNARWRGQDRPTNVLSFPAVSRPGIPGPLGDIAIAYETVTREAAVQDTPVADHLSHLVVHGFLHLLGYDHETDGDAERMEQLERDILARMGIADPYASRDAET